MAILSMLWMMTMVVSLAAVPLALYFAWSMFQEARQDGSWAITIPCMIVEVLLAAVMLGLAYISSIMRSLV